MRIFALETNVEKIKARFLHDGESEVLTTRFHIFSFTFAIVKEMILAAFLVVFTVFGLAYGWPMNWVGWTSGIILMGVVLPRVIKAYIDWMFDFIMITTDKILIVDQTSIFKREIKPIHLENVGGVSTETQFWDIFKFGELCLHLKEGLGGQSITKKYVPYAQRVAGILSDVVTAYQRLRPSNTGNRPIMIPPPIPKKPRTEQPKVVTVG